MSVTIRYAPATAASRTRVSDHSARAASLAGPGPGCVRQAGEADQDAAQPGEVRQPGGVAGRLERQQRPVHQEVAGGQGQQPGPGRGWRGVAVERGHGQDRGKVEQDPEGPRPERRRHDAGELGLQQGDQAGDDGQRREDPGSAVVPEGQRHENHDPGDAHQVIHRVPDAAGRDHQARRAARAASRPDGGPAPGTPECQRPAPRAPAARRAPRAARPAPRRSTGAERPRRPGTAGRPGRPRWRPPPSWARPPC